MHFMITIIQEEFIHLHGMVDFGWQVVGTSVVLTQQL